MAIPTRSAIETAFDVFDSDAMGMLTSDDVSLALRALGKDLNQIQLNDAIMNATGTDEVTSETRVSLEQFEKLVQEKFQTTAGPRPEAQRAFKLFDLRKKNQINEDDMVEVARQLGENPDNVRPKIRHFIDVGSNGSGALSCDQWLAIMDIKMPPQETEDIDEY